jgi:hypothetical protein
VPLLWTRAELDRIKQMYSAGARCEAACRLVVDAAEDRVRNVDYEQPTNAVGLRSRLYSTTGLGEFEREILDQHRPLLYMFLLGVSPAAVQLIDPTWQPPPDQADPNE